MVTSNSTELYFITLQHCVGLLKEEIQYSFPSWHFKQGHHNFVTYETDGPRELDEIREIPLIFKIGVGRLLATGDKLEIEELAKKAYEEYEALTIHRWDLVEEDGEMGDRKAKGPVIDIVHYSEHEYALGLRHQVRGDFAPYKGESPIPCPEINSKHGYQKMGEAFKHFRPHVGHEEVFLDIGCAPGGAAYYLLEHGYRVIGVDSHSVHSELTDRFNEGFLQLKQSVDEINVKHLKGLPPIDWVVTDIDQNLSDSFPFLVKLISKLDECRGIFVHIRMDDSNNNFTELENMEKTIRDAGYSLIRKSLLPAHGKEFCLFAKKED